ncbi:hypothetical protein IV102_05805 [bacterium]|nr:hypothetical protein [bacterium]
MNKGQLLRWVCFLACIPSGGALLLKVWGLASMVAGGALFLACLPILAFAYGWSLRHDLSLESALRVGCWGGLAGTVGYDLVRVPFHLYGYRVFAPIQAYGVWLLDSDCSSGLTEALGWLYHFSNGVTFGILYALVGSGRHWGWGVLWGLCLESIILSTPFAHIFHMQGNWPALAIAYGAHVAYGYPLGVIVQRGYDLPHRFKMLSGLLLGCFLFSSIPMEWSKDRRVLPATLQVEVDTLNPKWVRLTSTTTVTFFNPGLNPVTVIQPSGKRQLEVEPGTRHNWEFSQTGIYQFYVKTPGRSISSFVIVDPVEKL